MTVLELVTKTRSCRRFYEKEPIGTDQLKALVDLARLSPRPETFSRSNISFPITPAKT